MNIYDSVAELAKTVKYQNLFTVSKEFHSIKIFKNSMDLSNIQSIFLSYLYNFDSLNHDIIIDSISKHVYDNKIYWESYLLWKRKNNKKTSTKDNKQKDVNLVVGKTIHFPNKETK